MNIHALLKFLKLVNKDKKHTEEELARLIFQSCKINKNLLN